MHSRASQGTAVTSENGAVSNFLTWLNSIWVLSSYPFKGTHRNDRLHYRSELSRTNAKRIRLGDNVTIGRDACVLAHADDHIESERLVIEDKCLIGPRCVISAKNLVSLGNGTSLESDVLIMDHAHAYEDVTRPIKLQGGTPGGLIKIGRGCQIGKGAVILCGDRRELAIGDNCVIAPRSVVTRSFASGLFISGNPATAKRDDVQSRVPERSGAYNAVETLRSEGK